MLIKENDKNIAESKSSNVLPAAAATGSSASKLKLVNVPKNHVSLIPTPIIESIMEEQLAAAPSSRKIEGLSINGNTEEKQKFNKDLLKKSPKIVNGVNINAPTNASNGF